LGISYGEFEEGLSAEYMVAGIKDEWTALENKTKQAKKFIRRGHSIVPLKPAKIFIRTFGKTQVSVRGKSHSGVRMEISIGTRFIHLPCSSSPILRKRRNWARYFG